MPLSKEPVEFLIPSSSLKVSRPEWVDLEIYAVSDAPYVSNRITEKAVEGMGGAARRGKSRALKVLPKPEEEYEAAFWRTRDGRPGIPAVSFKRALVGAARFVKGLYRDYVSGIVFIIPPDQDDPDQVLPFEPGTVGPEMDVRIGRAVGAKGTVKPPIPKYRPIFKRWVVKLPIRFDSSLITAEQVISLIDRAGASVGVGEGRPEKTDMGWGRFHVAAAEEVSGALGKPEASAAS